nr:hypothetical protein CFP56_75516 [Quercus suber]
MSPSSRLKGHNRHMQKRVTLKQLDRHDLFHASSLHEGIYQKTTHWIIGHEVDSKLVYTYSFLLCELCLNPENLCSDKKLATTSRWSRTRNRLRRAREGGMCVRESRTKNEYETRKAIDDEGKGPLSRPQLRAKI